MLVAKEPKAHLKKVYLEQIVPELMKQHGYQNRHQVPELKKIVINSGFGAAVDAHDLDEVSLRGLHIELSDDEISDGIARIMTSRHRPDGASRLRLRGSRPDG